MKKLWLIALVCLLFGAVVWADDYDFRSVKWGMNKEEVATAEPQQLFKGSFGHKIPDNMLVYNDQPIMDMKFQLQYAFNDDRLVMAQYIPVIVPEKTKLTINPFAHIDTPAEVYEKGWAQAFDLYNKLKNLLTVKYGVPQEDTQKWTNETWKSVGGSVPAHIAKGHLIFNAKWDLGKTIIYLNCERNNKYLVEVLINKLCYYEPEYYKSLFSKEPAKEDLKDL